VVDTERDRILDMGGYVDKARAMGELTVSRSLGDVRCKPFVTWAPDVHSYDLSPDLQFLVIGCDGLWEALPDQTAVNIILKRRKDFRNRRLDAVVLRDHAFLAGSADNISTVVVHLQDVPTPPPPSDMPHET